MPIPSQSLSEYKKEMKNFLSEQKELWEAGFEDGIELKSHGSIVDTKQAKLQMGDLVEQRKHVKQLVKSIRERPGHTHGVFSLPFSKAF